MKNAIIKWLLAAVAFIIFLAFTGAFYTVPETEQVIITQFGKPVGDPVTEAGLHFKLPFIQDVNHVEKQVLEWDGPSTEMPTKDKLYIVTDAFGRWRVSDPLQFFLRLREERTAQLRLDDILGSEMRNAVARHELVELIRTTKDRKPQEDEVLGAGLGNTNELPPIQYGRVKLEEEIAGLARTKLAEFGIELLDFRFKRINYNHAVAGKIYDRMVSERRQIAERFRSEGAAMAARINGTRERDINQIQSEAYEKVQVIQGKADAEATAIYAKAFNQSAAAREYYAFQRTLDAYRTSFDRQTTVVLTTDSGFLRYLKGGPTDTPAPLAPPVPGAAATSQP